MKSRLNHRRHCLIPAVTELLETRRMFADVPRELVDVLHQGLWDVAYDAQRGEKNELVT